jgi:hypothetical protein
MAGSTGDGKGNQGNKDTQPKASQVEAKLQQQQAKAVDPKATATPRLHKYSEDGDSEQYIRRHDEGG